MACPGSLIRYSAAMRAAWEPIMQAFLAFLFFAAYVSPVFVLRGLEAIARGSERHAPLVNA